LTDDNSNNDLVDMDLDTFEKDFFQAEPSKEHVPAEKDIEEVEESNENREDSPETEEDTDASIAEDEDQSEDEGDDEGEEESEPEEKPQAKKGKKSAQERINEITARAYEAERRAAEAERRLAEASRQTEEVRNQDRTPLREQLPAEAPQPDAVDDKGEPVYALGEFDPNYIRDLTQFTIHSEAQALRERQMQESEAAQIAAAQRQLAQSWAEKVETVEAEIPELRENIAGLATTFAGIDPSYGEYLATTIMESEVGPQIMNYLSQNIGEAQRIVASGPRAATLALGRLEAQLSSLQASEERRDEKKVTDAPTPPAKGARGSGARKSIRPDTENLADFEKIFFN
jgi:hypothetical protein